MNNWFTPERRQLIQVFAASLAPLLILFGFGTENGWEQWLIILGAALQFLSNIVSLFSLKKGDWSRASEIFRGSLYGLGAVVAPALATLGLISSEQSGFLLVGLSLGLAALGNVVAIFTGKAQQLHEVELALVELEPAPESPNSRL